jgi:hypothetical protein
MNVLNAYPLPGPPLPDALPAAPSLPVEYLHREREQIVDTESLSHSEQVALVASLEGRLKDEEQAVTARDLLQRLRRRPDVTESVAQSIDRVLGEPAKTTPPAPPESKPPPRMQSPVTTDRQAWSGGAFVALLVLSLFIPLAGWIVGGVNLKHTARRGQAWALIVVGIAGAVLYGIAQAQQASTQGY